MRNIEVLGNTLLNWLNDSSMKANTGKYHLLYDSSKITIGIKTISGGKFEKLVGIKIDNNQNFKEKVKKLMLDLHH